MTESSYHARTEEPVLDDEGQYVRDDNGDIIYEYTYGVYFPPKYDSIIRWVGIKIDTGSRVNKVYSIWNIRRN